MSGQEAAFATGVPPDIYEFHLYTRNSASLSALKLASIECMSGVEPRDFTLDLASRLRTLYAQ